MRLLRRIVLTLFVLVYLVACPLAILYALGYVVRPGDQPSLVKTGLIYVSSAPPDASIFINRRHYPHRTPTVIRGLLPGAYQLHVTSRHHQPWIRTITVEAEKAFVLDHVLLLPQQPVPESLVPGAWRDLLPIPETRFMLVASGDALDDLAVFDWETGESWPLIPAGSPFQGGPVTFQTAVQGSPVVLLRVHLRRHEAFIRAELAKHRTRLADLTSLFPEKLQRVEWEPRAPHQLYVLQNREVNRLDSEAMAIYPQVAEGVRGYGVGNGALYVLTEGLVCERIERDGRRETVPLSPELVNALVETRSTFRISVWPSETLLFLGERGELLTNRPPYRLADADVQGVTPDVARERALVWRRDALGVLDVAALRRSDEEPPEPPPLQWVFLDGRDIQQAFWVFQRSHALIRDRDAVFLFELDAPAPRAVQRLVQVRPRSSVVYVEDTGRLYFLDRETGGLCALPLVPKREPLPLPFPELLEEGSLPLSRVQRPATPTVAR